MSGSLIPFAPSYLFKHGGEAVQGEVNRRGVPKATFNDLHVDTADDDFGRDDRTGQRGNQRLPNLVLRADAAGERH